MEKTDKLGAIRPKTDPEIIDRRINVPSDAETIRPSVDIADKKLPGNYGWTGRLVSAAENKWMSFNTWDKTYGDRAISSRKARTADLLNSKIKSLQGERETCADYLDKMRNRIDDINEKDSRFSNTGLGRKINGARIRWHSMQAGWWERSIKDLDAQLGDVNSRHQKALNTKAYHDSRINDVIARAETRLNGKLSSIQRLRAEVDTSAEKYKRSIDNYELLRTKMLGEIDAIKGERRRGGMTNEQFAARQQALSALRERVRQTNRILDEHKEKYLRCIDHQKRLANAHGDARAARDSITGRMYREAARISLSEDESEAPESPETDTEPAVRTEILRYHLESGEAQEVTLKQFHDLWNGALPGAEMRDGRKFTNPKDLFALWDATFPEGTNAPVDLTDDIRENGFKNVGGWRTFIESLYKANDEFKAFVRGETQDAKEAMDRISLFAANKFFL